MLNFTHRKTQIKSRARCVGALREADVQGQSGIHRKFQTSQSYIVRPCLTIYEVRAHLRGVQYACFGDDHESLFCMKMKHDEIYLNKTYSNKPVCP